MLVLLLLTEFTLVLWLQAQSIIDYIASRDPVTGTVYYTNKIENEGSSEAYHRATENHQPCNSKGVNAHKTNVGTYGGTTSVSQSVRQTPATIIALRKIGSSMQIREKETHAKMRIRASKGLP